MNNLTEIVILLDKSGSMDSKIKETVQSLTEFITEQKSESLVGEATISIILFSHETEVLYDGVNIKDIDMITENQYKPFGWTALNDAIGSTIESVHKRLYFTPLEKRPNNVICVIITDGEENYSSKYNIQQIKKMIEKQQKDYNWVFVYLGANVDAFKNSQNYGISNYANVDYNTARGVKSTYMTTSNVVAEFRSKGANLDNEAIQELYKSFNSDKDKD